MDLYNVIKSYAFRLLKPNTTLLLKTPFLFSSFLLSLIILGCPANAKYASFVINENTKRIYHNTNADTRNYPASLTKIMTLYMIFDALESKKISMKTKLNVSKRASRQPPSKLYLSPGSRITVKNAIMALITKSANDVATVVAENLGKSERNFAKLMTKKAKQLGMTRTTFKNASGLPNRGQLSTARDMATLGMAIRRDHPKFFKLFKTKPSKPLVRIAKPSEVPLARPTISIVEKSVKNFNIPPTLKLPPSDKEEDWFIQIGAFKNRLNAHKAARNARNMVPEQLANLPASLSKITRTSNKNNTVEYLWRVRFIELAEYQARSVCAELWTSGFSCIPLPENTDKS